MSPAFLIFLVVSFLTTNQAASFYRRLKPSEKNAHKGSSAEQFPACDNRGFRPGAVSCQVSKSWTTVPNSCNGRICKQVQKEVCSPRWRRTQVCSRTTWRTVRDISYVPTEVKRPAPRWMVHVPESIRKRLNIRITTRKPRVTTHASTSRTEAIRTTLRSKSTRPPVVYVKATTEKLEKPESQSAASATSFESASRSGGQPNATQRIPNVPTSKMVEIREKTVNWHALENNPETKTTKDAAPKSGSTTTAGISTKLRDMLVTEPTTASRHDLEVIISTPTEPTIAEAPGAVISISPSATTHEFRENIVTTTGSMVALDRVSPSGTLGASAMAGKIQESSTVVGMWTTVAQDNIEIASENLWSMTESSDHHTLSKTPRTEEFTAGGLISPEEEERAPDTETESSVRSTTAGMATVDALRTTTPGTFGEQAETSSAQGVSPMEGSEAGIPPTIGSTNASGGSAAASELHPAVPSGIDSEEVATESASTLAETKADSDSGTPLNVADSQAGIEGDTGALRVTESGRGTVAPSSFSSSDPAVPTDGPGRTSDLFQEVAGITKAVLDSVPDRILDRPTVTEESSLPRAEVPDRDFDPGTVRLSTSGPQMKEDDYTAASPTVATASQDTIQSEEVRRITASDRGTTYPQPDVSAELVSGESTAMTSHTTEKSKALTSEDAKYLLTDSDNMASALDATVLPDLLASLEDNSNVLVTGSVTRKSFSSTVPCAITNESRDVIGGDNSSEATTLKKEAGSSASPSESNERFSDQSTVKTPDIPDNFGNSTSSVISQFSSSPSSPSVKMADGTKQTTGTTTSVESFPETSELLTTNAKGPHQSSNSSGIEEITGSETPKSVALSAHGTATASLTNISVPVASDGRIMGTNVTERKFEETTVTSASFTSENREAKTSGVEDTSAVTESLITTARYRVTETSNDGLQMRAGRQNTKTASTLPSMAETAPNSTATGDDVSSPAASDEKFIGSASEAQQFEEFTVTTTLSTSDEQEGETFKTGHTLVLTENPTTNATYRCDMEANSTKETSTGVQESFTSTLPSETGTASENTASGDYALMTTASTSEIGSHSVSIINKSDTGISVGTTLETQSVPIPPEKFNAGISSTTSGSSGAGASESGKNLASLGIASSKLKRTDDLEENSNEDGVPLATLEGTVETWMTVTTADDSTSQVADDTSAGMKPSTENQTGPASSESASTNETGNSAKVGDTASSQTPDLDSAPGTLSVRRIRDPDSRSTPDLEDVASTSGTGSGSYERSSPTRATTATDDVTSTLTSATPGILRSSTTQVTTRGRAPSETEIFYTEVPESLIYSGSTKKLTETGNGEITTETVTPDQVEAGESRRSGSRTSAEISNVEELSAVPLSVEGSSEHPGLVATSAAEGSDVGETSTQGSEILVGFSNSGSTAMDEDKESETEQSDAIISAKSVDSSGAHVVEDVESASGEKASPASGSLVEQHSEPVAETEPESIAERKSSPSHGTAGDPQSSPESHIGVVSKKKRKKKMRKKKRKKSGGEMATTKLGNTAQVRSEVDPDLLTKTDPDATESSQGTARSRDENASTLAGPESTSDGLRELDRSSPSTQPDFTMKTESLDSGHDVKLQKGNRSYARASWGLGSRGSSNDPVPTESVAPNSGDPTKSAATNSGGPTESSSDSFWGGSEAPESNSDKGQGQQSKTSPGKTDGDSKTTPGAGDAPDKTTLEADPNDEPNNHFLAFDTSWWNEASPTADSDALTITDPDPDAELTTSPGGTSATADPDALTITDPDPDSKLATSPGGTSAPFLSDPDPTSPLHIAATVLLLLMVLVLFLFAWRRRL